MTATSTDIARSIVPDRSPSAPVVLSLLAASWRDLAVVAAVLAWIPAVLGLDSIAGLWAQRGLGVGTWLFLLALLCRESPRVRAQVAIVVVFASLVEYTFSGWLGVYVYRLHNVPWFVSPGHGLVYLGALAFGRTAVAEGYRRRLVAVALVGGAAYALWGLVGSTRLDALGAFWFVCLALFLAAGRNGTVYVGAFVIVTYLELLGTHIGTWTWQLHDPTGIVAIGNPPSGAAGGYGFFDAAALAGAPWLERRFRRRQPRSGSPPARP